MAKQTSQSKRKMSLNKVRKSLNGPVSKEGTPKESKVFKTQKAIRKLTPKDKKKMPLKNLIKQIKL